MAEGYFKDVFQKTERVGKDAPNRLTRTLDFILKKKKSLCLSELVPNLAVLVSSMVNTLRIAE